MPELTRRALLRGLAATAAGAVLGRAFAGAPRVVVVGAGAFGGWTALELAVRGARVTLLDAWGPGNPRSSSGGETRLMRRIYGPDEIYMDMAARSMEKWRARERQWGWQYFHRTGLLWLVVDTERYHRAALGLMDEKGFPYERLEVAEVARRYPWMRFDGVRWAVYEPEAGFLLARQGCEAVLEAFLAAGGAYHEAKVTPGPMAAGRMAHVLAGDRRIEADAFVFACGPWLGRLFPGVREDLVVPTRQEVFFFQTPEGDERYVEPRMPCWINHQEGHIAYGTPASHWTGFKVANDARGPRFDPTDGDRTPSETGLAAARRALALRFPALADAPLADARVCQYENSPDSNLIVDCHPAASNVYLVGGGSGHGYKLGAAVGELAAGLVLDGVQPHSLFRLARFGAPKP